MNRLLLTLGLVIAFFISTAQASIFDNASYQTPEIDSSTKFGHSCSTYVQCSSSNQLYPDLQSIFTKIESSMPSGVSRTTAWTKRAADFNCVSPSDCQVTMYYKADFRYSSTNAWHSQQVPTVSTFSVTTTSCPPDAYPSYTFGRDTDNDGDDDQCYNPIELDNASNCQNQLGNMLPALNYTSLTVCKTDENTGASCAYSKSSLGNSYHLNLEESCFGDSEQTAPEYDPQPIPEPVAPAECKAVNNGLKICNADPTKECDASGNCTEQCGHINDKFFCFHACEGASCDEEELPTPTPEYCTLNPTAKICIDVPIPEPCVGDDCVPDGDGSGTGTGTGSGGSIDLSPVVDELKKLNEKLDFDITTGDSNTELGLLETAFDQESIDDIKARTSDMKDDISSFIDSSKSQLSSMFTFSGGGGSYTPITFNFTYGTYSTKIWDYFVENVSIIAAAIMFLAYLLAARIVLE
jgi:hypothetical protein